MYYSLKYLSPLGPIEVVSTETHIVGLWLEGQKYYAGKLANEKIILKPDLQVLRQAKSWLDKYFANQKPKIDEVPIEMIGGDFRKRVWQILCEIPYGETVTYGEIAKTIAKQMGKSTMSAQAVGGAVGHNPISIIVPCHRVVGTNGKLTGYASGLDKKIKLLEMEGVNIVNEAVGAKVI